MVRRRDLHALLVRAALGLLPALAQAGNPVKPNPPALLPLSSIPKAADPALQAERPNFLQRVTAAMQTKDVAGARKVLAEYAARMAPNDPFYDELEGSLLSMQKDYAGAQAAFGRELEKAPDSVVARFNRAEMIMLQKHGEAAEKEFAAIEDLASSRDAGLADLCRFKRVICLLGERENARAEALVPAARGENESPALSFARAAIECNRNKLDVAMAILDDVRTRFSPDVESLYVDSLIELNWGLRDAEGKFYFRPKFR